MLGTETRRISVWYLISFTGLAWGGGGLASKWLVNGSVDAYTVTAGPFLVAALVAWCAAALAGNIRSEAIPAAVFLGVVNSAIPALFFNIGYETLSAGLVTLLVSFAPVVTAGVAHLVFLDEAFNPLKGAGLVLACAGVAALVVAPGVIEGASYGGAAWVIAGAVIAGSTAVATRHLAMKHGALALIAPQLTAAGLTPVVAGLLVGRSLIPASGFTVTEVAVIAAIGVVASYGGFRAILLANEAGTTGQVSMVAYLIPLVGVTGGIAFFDETLTSGIVMGAILILSGVMLGGRGSRPGRLARSAG